MGNRIKEAREAQNMTQTELAARSGVTRATIWALEKDRSKVTTTKTLTALANALGVSVSQILSTDEN